LELNEVRLKVCCVAGEKLIHSQADLEEEKSRFSRRQKSQALERKQSSMAGKDFNLAGGGSSPPGSPRAVGGGGSGGFADNEDLSIKVQLEQLLFEVEAEDFGDILAELKVRQHQLLSVGEMKKL
jgi:hypothetical protein